MKSLLLAAAFLISFLCPSVTNAQLPAPPKPAKELDILKKEVGKWNATMKAWFAPGNPTVSKGVEVNKMMGGYWLITNFDGEFAGQKFKGHATFGYDAKTKKYFGTWMDNMNPVASKMTGTYDAKTKTMTYLTTGVGPEGSPTKGKNVVVYESDDKRVMTMDFGVPGSKEMSKGLEITYTRAK